MKLFQFFKRQKEATRNGRDYAIWRRTAAPYGGMRTVEYAIQRDLRFDDFEFVLQTRVSNLNPESPSEWETTDLEYESLFEELYDRGYHEGHAEGRKDEFEVGYQTALDDNGISVDCPNV